MTRGRALDGKLENPGNNEEAAMSTSVFEKLHLVELKAEYAVTAKV